MDVGAGLRIAYSNQLLKAERLICLAVGLPAHTADTGDDSSGRDLLLPVQMEGCQLRKFQKRRTRIQKTVDAVASNQLSWKQRVNYFWDKIMKIF